MSTDLELTEINVDSYLMVCLTQENTEKNKSIPFEPVEDKPRTESKIQFDLTHSDSDIKEWHDIKYYVCAECNGTFERKKKKPFKHSFCSYKCYSK